MANSRQVAQAADALAAVAITALTGPLSEVGAQGLKQVAGIARTHYEQHNETRDLQAAIKSNLLAWADAERVSDDQAMWALSQAGELIATCGPTPQLSASWDYNAGRATDAVMGLARRGKAPSVDDGLVEAAVRCTYSATYAGWRAKEPVLLPLIQAVRADIAGLTVHIDDQFQEQTAHLDGQFREQTAELKAALTSAGQHRTGPVVAGRILDPAEVNTRRAQFEDLERELAIPGTVVLWGSPGTGKSHLAAEAARRRVTQQWPLVGWVSGETSGSLLTGLHEVAIEIGVADPDGDSNRSARRLRNFLATAPDARLLVIDNLGDPRDVQPYLPATGSARVVITSTDPNAARLGRNLRIPGFTREQSIWYLSERTNIDDPEGAAALAAELDDLPVALAQAAAALAERGSFGQFLAKLRALPVEQILRWRAGQDYPRSTGAALLLNVQAAEQPPSDAPPGTGQLVNRMLRVAAVLDPAGVEVELLGELGKTQDEGDDPQAELMLEEASGRCLEHDLFTDTISESGPTAWVMHRLVGHVLRDRDAAACALGETIEWALSLLESQMFHHSEAAIRRGQGDALVSHIHSVASTARSAVSHEVYLRLFDAQAWAARQLYEAGDLGRAIPLHEQTLADRLRVLGPDHPDTLASRNNLAGAYYLAGDLGRAIPLYEQTLADTERVLGPDHPQTLISRNNLAVAYEAGRRP